MGNHKEYSFSIFWPLCCMSFFDLRLPITPLVSLALCVVCPALIYDQRGNQKPKIKDGDTTQRAKNTKGVIRSRNAEMDIQHKGQKIPKR
jgi:hypothetical protein